MIVMDESEWARNQLKAIAYLLKLNDIRVNSIYNLVHVLRTLVGYPRVNVESMIFTRTVMELECVGWLEEIEEALRRKRLDGEPIKDDLNALHAIADAKVKELLDNYDKGMSDLVEELMME